MSLADDAAAGAKGSIFMVRQYRRQYNSIGDQWERIGAPISAWEIGWVKRSAYATYAALGALPNSWNVLGY